MTMGAKKDLKDFKLQLYLLKDSIKTVCVILLNFLENNPRRIASDFLQD
jgi:hypothetical protein